MVLLGVSLILCVYKPASPVQGLRRIIKTWTPLRIPPFTKDMCDVQWPGTNQNTDRLSLSKEPLVTGHGQHK